MRYTNTLLRLLIYQTKEMALEKQGGLEGSQETGKT